MCQNKEQCCEDKSAAPVPLAKGSVFHPVLCLRGSGWGMGGEHEMVGVLRLNPLKPQCFQQIFKA